jgi:hypothetical protein
VLEEGSGNVAGLKDSKQLILPVVLMCVLAISMWPGMSQPMAQALGLGSGQNFSTAYALSFCAGVFFPPRLRWSLPLGMFVIVNILTNVHYGVNPLDRYIFVKVAAFALLIWLGTRYTPKESWFKLVRGGVLGSILFYLITNTAAWWWDPAYPKTLAGWIQALTIGTPGFPPTIHFLFNSLLSGGLFTGLFAGAMKLTAAEDVKESKAEKEEPAEEAEGELPQPEKSEA